METCLLCLLNKLLTALDLAQIRSLSTDGERHANKLSGAVIQIVKIKHDMVYR